MKKKKLKISTASASGSRMVFDEDGQAQDPLAQLSLPGEGRCGVCFHVHHGAGLFCNHTD